MYVPTGLEHEIDHADEIYRPRERLRRLCSKV
jgi:hypothetical protein